MKEEIGIYCLVFSVLTIYISMTLSDKYEVTLLDLEIVEVLHYVVVVLV